MIEIAALDEIERRIERIIDIAFETHARIEHERQHAGARRIRVGPDLRAHRQEAVGLAVGEGRIGEKRGDQRLQGKAKPHFRDHVGFRGEIDIGLHRGGAEHHVEAELSDLGHVARHDRVALLGHDRRLVARPQRTHAKIEKADAKSFADRRERVEMRLQLGSGLVNVIERRARTIRTGRPAPAKSRRRRADRTGQ